MCQTCYGRGLRAHVVAPGGRGNKMQRDAVIQLIRSMFSAVDTDRVCGRAGALCCSSVALLKCRAIVSAGLERVQFWQPAKVQYFFGGGAANQIVGNPSDAQWIRCMPRVHAMFLSTFLANGPGRPPSLSYTGGQRDRQSTLTHKLRLNFPTPERHK